MSTTQRRRGSLRGGTKACFRVGHGVGVDGCVPAVVGIADSKLWYVIGIVWLTLSLLADGELCCWCSFDQLTVTGECTYDVDPRLSPQPASASLPQHLHGWSVVCIESFSG